MNTIDEWQTALKQQLAEGSNNRGDIPAEYNLNSGRHRAFITPDGGNRQRVVNRSDLNGASGLVKVGNTTLFNDLDKGFGLNPNAGDVVEYGSAERFRYVPGYEFQFGVLTKLLNGGAGLADGQKLIIRFGIPTDAYEYEYHGGAEHRVQLQKGGAVVTDSVKKRSEWVNDPFNDEQASLSRPAMHIGEFVHYGGGEFDPQVSFLNEDLRQEKQRLRRTGNREEIATDEVNGFVRVIYDCSESSSGGTCKVGDIQAKVLGGASEKSRENLHRHRDLGTSSNFAAGTWEIAALIRGDPSRDNINVDITRLELEPTQVAEAQVWAVPKETIPYDGSLSWFTPVGSDPQDTVVEAAIVPEAERTNYPSRTANGETHPEARQLADVRVSSSGQGQEDSNAELSGLKSILHEDEYGLLGVRFDNSGAVNTTRYGSLEDF